MAYNDTSETSSINLSPKYDKSTFWGRYYDFSSRISTQFLYVNENRLSEAKKVFEAAQKEDVQTLKKLKVNQEKFDDARDLIESVVHPQSGKTVPWYARMSAFCPLNIPICAGMLLSSPTVLNSVFWQTINQTYNALFNYENANKSVNSGDGKPKKFLEEYGDVLKGYASATFVSVTLAVGLNQYLQRGKFRPAVKKGLQAIVPFIAVASAGAANVVFMRLNEISDGIPVYSKNGEFLGNSKEAAKSAIFQTAISRAALPIPNLVIPPAIMSVLYNVPLIRNYRAVKLATELGVLYLCMSIGFPMAVAIFPQEATLSKNAVEPEIANKLKRSEYVGDDEMYVQFNKGV